MSDSKPKPQNPIPNGFNTLTPFLVAKDAQRLIDFANKAFGAETVTCLRYKDGTIWNAEFQVGSSKLLVAQAHGENQPFPAFLYVYLEDTDAAYAAAIEAGGQSLMEPSDQFYGDRNAGVMDHDGNVWWIATRVEDVPFEEVQKRAEEFESRKRSQ